MPGLFRRRHTHVSGRTREEDRRRREAESWQRMKDQVAAKNARMIATQGVTTHA